LTSAISGETQTPSGASDGEVIVMEFVANYSTQKNENALLRKGRRTDAYPGYQVYDARCAVDPEWNEFFRGGKAQVADNGMSKMSVRLCGFWR